MTFSLCVCCLSTITISHAKAASLWSAVTCHRFNFAGGCLEERRVLATHAASPLDWGGVFIVTAATLHKSHVFQGSQRLELLQTRLLSMAKQYGCQLEAWAVFPNHYHFVG